VQCDKKLFIVGNYIKKICHELSSYKIYNSFPRCSVSFEINNFSIGEQMAKRFIVKDDEGTNNTCSFRRRISPCRAGTSRRVTEIFKMVTQENEVLLSMASVQAAPKYASHEAIEKYCYLYTKDVDCVSRVRFCNWFCEATRSGNADLLVTCLQTKHCFT